MHEVDEFETTCQRRQHMLPKLSLLRNNSHGDDVGVSMNVGLGAVHQGVS